MRRFVALVALAVLLTFQSSSVVFAGAGVVGGAQPPAEESTSTGFTLQDAGFRFGYLPTLGLQGQTDPVTAVDSLLLRYVVNPVFFLAGGVAILVMMYSSFRIIAARGEEEGLTAAKNALIWAAAGLALVVLAYTLVRNLAEIVLENL